MFVTIYEDNIFQQETSASTIEDIAILFICCKFISGSLEFAVIYFKTLNSRVYDSKSVLYLCRSTSVTL